MLLGERGEAGSRRAGNLRSSGRGGVLGTAKREASVAHLPGRGSAPARGGSTQGLPGRTPGAARAASSEAAPGAAAPGPRRAGGGGERGGRPPGSPLAPIPALRRPDEGKALEQGAHLGRFEDPGSLRPRAPGAAPRPPSPARNALPGATVTAGVTGTPTPPCRPAAPRSLPRTCPRSPAPRAAGADDRGIPRRGPRRGHQLWGAQGRRGPGPLPGQCPGAAEARSHRLAGRALTARGSRAPPGRLLGSPLPARGPGWGGILSPLGSPWG